MALKEIANSSCTLSHSTGSTTSGGMFTITSPPSLTVKADGSPIYSGTIMFSFSGGNSSETLGSTGVFVPGSMVGVGTIDPTAVKVKADGSLVSRVDDSGTFTTLSGSFTLTSNGVTSPGVPAPPTNVEITDAGQTKVLAN